MPQKDVAYLTYAPGLSSPWVVSPDRPFRAQGLLLWGWHPQRTVIQSLLFAGEEQIVQPGPAYIWDSKISLADFLGKALREPAELAWPRATLRAVELHRNYPISRLAAAPLYVPAVNAHAEISIAFTGELTAIALLGAQLL